MQDTKYKSIAYIPLICESYSFSHVKLLNNARVLSDYVVVGIIPGASSIPVSERFAILNSTKLVDKIYVQNDVEPLNELTELHEKHPNSKLILYSDSEESTPSKNFVISRGGEVVQPEYFKRSTTTTFEECCAESSEIFKTKGQTLQKLASLLNYSSIEPLVLFTVDNWNRSQGLVISNIFDTLKGANRLIVRSSSLSEDAFEESKAGHYNSFIVENKKESLIEGIEKIISSYDGDINNEVLVQTLIENVVFSGVVFTKRIDDAPYYTINFDTSGSTDGVTSGAESEHIEIARDVTKTGNVIWDALLKSIRELEVLSPDIPLDIEFAINRKNEVIIMQARPLAAKKIVTSVPDFEVFEEIKDMQWLIEDSIGYSDMAFWNPSEMIGTHPNPLDGSLYEYLITDDAWNIALSDMGYKELDDKRLMYFFGGKPYISLTKAFSGLLPSGLDDEILKKTLEECSRKIHENPALHDKIEFDIVPNCWYYGIKCGSETKEKLKQQTIEIISGFKYRLKKYSSLIDKLNEERTRKLSRLDKNDYRSYINTIGALLDDAIDYGVIPFSQVARMAFMSNIIMNSLRDNGIVSQKAYDNFFSSLDTIHVGEHLRAGTYNILSPRYGNLIGKQQEKIVTKRKYPTIHELEKELSISSDDFFFFAKMSMEWREKLKFEFTKNISESLELIAELGVVFGFDREDMSQLKIREILRSFALSKDTIKIDWKGLVRSRRRLRNIQSKLSLPPVIFNKSDFSIVKNIVSKPNFVTEKEISGFVSGIDGDVTGKIIVLEKADPGYDWIFTKGIKGLVTCYGGVASHMAIRCAELGIPAAIGCGVDLYKDIIKMHSIILDCKKGEIKNIELGE